MRAAEFSPALKVCGGNAGSRRLSGNVFQAVGPATETSVAGPTAVVVSFLYQRFLGLVLSSVV